MLNMPNILDTIRRDYQCFPRDQSREIYAPDVFFKDPMTEFRGLDRYVQMIGFIDRFFHNPQLDLHKIVQEGAQIRTDWTLTWTTPLPWQPRTAISGWSELTLNEAGLIASHIDYWHCSKWDVLKQQFVRSR
jgi:Uncharacterized conserved protein (DUF2358)